MDAAVSLSGLFFFPVCVVETVIHFPEISETDAAQMMETDVI